MSQSANLTCANDGGVFSVYFNPGGDCTTPAWSFHKGIKGDIGLNETDEEIEQSDRDPANWVKVYLQGKTDVEISGTQNVDQLYEGCAFFNSSRWKGQPIDVLILSGPITRVGVVGWRGKWNNFDRSAESPDGSPPSQNFKLKPAACQITACKVRPVKVAIANAIVDYTPNTYTPTT